MSILLLLIVAFMLMAHSMFGTCVQACVRVRACVCSRAHARMYVCVLCMYVRAPRAGWQELACELRLRARF